MPTDLEDLAPVETRLAQHTTAMRSDVLARLSTSRRRRVWPIAALVSGAVALLALGSVVVVRDRPVPPALQAASAQRAYLSQGAFSVGRTVFVGDHRVVFRDRVRSLLYTSAGVVVHHGRSASADAAGTSRYSLVSPMGSVRDLDLPLDNQLPGTSPSSPLLAYAEPAAASTWRLVVVDVRTGAQHATTTVDGAYSWAGWVAPPVNIDGDHVRVLLDSGWVEWDMAGDTTRAISRPGLADTPLEAGGGRYVEQHTGRIDIRDFSDGRTVFGHALADDGDQVTVDHLSPGGQVVRYDETFTVYDEHHQLISSPHGGILYDLDRHRRLALGTGPWGWTPDGRALRVETAKDLVTTCSALLRSCRTTRRSLPHGTVKLGGVLYGR
ncbi:hypothetical protein D9V37_05850 [Nocardioides mangrovicus]|uniref:WD40 repeat domain-containing protein n=1 Tax=Nocardioides mangrovicus TaxID=2478913 RepID=A0A3L8P6J9_9ACTN|nr:hypothetical protein [Nocardioides mangrovicus]RLV50239.1 hypothetical protein D9V37_05850 [Nocardioides mangrovicus]